MLLKKNGGFVNSCTCIKVCIYTSYHYKFPSGECDCSTISVRLRKVSNMKPGGGGGTVGMD